ncbi:MAG: hypothetical protein RL112_1247 [Planctomycetota bacterium]|jgi:hypothetical protein
MTRLHDSTRLGPRRLLFAAATLAASLAPLGCGSGGGSTSPGAQARVWRVAPAGAGEGASWMDPIGLQAALASARAGDELWLKSGTYKPGASRDDAFMLVPGVAIYGGFGGFETARAQRDPYLHVATLDGDLAGNDGPDWTGREDNAYHVVVAIDCPATTVLDGVVVRGGAATGDGQGPKAESRDQGAAINIFGGGPTFVAVVVEHNLASNHGAINDHGEGSLYVDCVFRHNRSLNFGGGLYLHDHAASTIERGCFADNEAANEGGGLYIRSHMLPRVVDSMFLANRALRGGGTFGAAGALPSIEGCLYQGNEAEIGGGGVFLEFNDGMVAGSRFVDNAAGLEVEGGGGGGGGSGGGGVWTTGGAPTVSDCEFVDNRASFGAGVYHIEESAALVEDCLFERNAATEGGGLYTLGSPSVARRSLFVENSASGTDFSVGGGMSNYFSDSVVEDCVFRANRAELGGGGVYLEGEDPILRSSLFVGNEAFGSLEGWGGGVLFGYFARVRMESCELVGNRARKGGGVHAMAFSAPLLVHLSLVANEAPEGSGFAGHPLNDATLAGSLLANEGPAEFGSARPRVTTNCLVRGENLPFELHELVEEPPAPGPDGLHGTSDDPAWSLAPSPGSALVDAGEDQLLDPAWPWDARHQQRRVALHGGGGPVVDLGACERGAP